MAPTPKPQKTSTSADSQSTETPENKLENTGEIPKAESAPDVPPVTILQRPKELDDPDEDIIPYARLLALVESILEEVERQERPIYKAPVTQPPVQAGDQNTWMTNVSNHFWRKEALAVSTATGGQMPTMYTEFQPQRKPQPLLQPQIQSQFPALLHTLLPPPPQFPPQPQGLLQTQPPPQIQLMPRLHPQLPPQHQPTTIRYWYSYEEYNAFCLQNMPYICPPNPGHPVLTAPREYFDRVILKMWSDYINDLPKDNPDRMYLEILWENWFSLMNIRAAEERRITKLENELLYQNGTTYPSEIYANTEYPTVAVHPNSGEYSANLNMAAPSNRAEYPSSEAFINVSEYLNIEDALKIGEILNISEPSNAAKYNTGEYSMGERLNIGHSNVGVPNAAQYQNGRMYPYQSQYVPKPNPNLETDFNQRYPKREDHLNRAEYLNVVPNSNTGRYITGNKDYIRSEYPNMGQNSNTGRLHNAYNSTIQENNGGYVNGHRNPILGGNNGVYINANSNPILGGNNGVYINGNSNPILGGNNGVYISGNSNPNLGGHPNPNMVAYTPQQEYLNPGATSLLGEYPNLGVNPNFREYSNNQERPNIVIYPNAGECFDTPEYFQRDNINRPLYFYRSDLNQGGVQVAPNQIVYKQEHNGTPVVIKKNPTVNQVVMKREPSANHVVIRKEPTVNQVVIKKAPTVNQVVIKNKPTANQVVIKKEATNNQGAVKKVFIPKKEAKSNNKTPKEATPNNEVALAANNMPSVSSANNGGAKNQAPQEEKNQLPPPRNGGAYAAQQDMLPIWFDDEVCEVCGGYCNQDPYEFYNNDSDDLPDYEPAQETSPDAIDYQVRGI